MIGKTIKKGVKKVSGLVSLVGGIASAFVPAITYASNPADLTADYRQFPVPAGKVVYNSKNEKAALLNVPFAENKDYNGYIFGWSDGKSTKLLQGNVSVDKGPLDLGLQATKIWSEGADIPVDYTLSLDLSNEIGGFASVIDFKNPEESQIGARLNTGKITSYFMSALKELEPVLGISYNGDIPVHLSYDHSTKTYQLRTQKAFDSYLGTIIPELRLKN